MQNLTRYVSKLCTPAPCGL